MYDCLFYYYYFFYYFFFDDNRGILHVFELRTGMNEFDHRSFLSLLKQQRERPYTGRKNGFTSNLPSANMMQNYVCPRANL